MSEETEEERQRRFARERKRRQRERQSPSDAAAARAKDTLRRKLRLSQENEYEREMRRRNERMRKRLQRLRASQGEMLERRRIEKERIAERREQLSQEEIEDRRKVERERIAFKRRNSSLEETEERRRIERERIAERRENESDEAAQQRREKNAENMRRLRARTRVREETSSSSATSSVSNFLGQHDSFLSQPTAAKFCKRPGNQFENQCFENLQQKSMTNSVQQSFPTHIQMPVQQHILPVPRKVQQPTLTALKQVLETPVQVAVAKRKPVEKTRPREKRLLAIADHQRGVMSSLVSLWKSGKLCDASIGNGSANIKVHKLVLSALCPKLVSVFNMDMMSSKFLQVNFPKEVSTEALNAFAEYMYNGILDLDQNILRQLKIIAKRLDMEEFENLCDSHLPKHIPPPASAAVSLLNNPLFQKCMSIPAGISSLGSTSSQSSFTSQVMDIKHEISEVKKEATAVFGHETEVASLASNKSGNTSDCIVNPTRIKTELVVTEDDKYGHYWCSGSNQSFTSATLSSSLIAPTGSSSVAEATIVSTSIPSSSSTEFTIPFTETDVKSSRLKVLHSYETPLLSDVSPVSNIVETVCMQSNSKNEHISKRLVQTSNSQPTDNFAKTSNCNNAIYPIRLFSAKGDNLPLLTKNTSSTTTVNSFIQSEKT